MSDSGAARNNPKHPRNWWLKPLVGALGGYLASLIG